MFVGIILERSGNFLLPQPLQKLLKWASSSILDGLTGTQGIAKAVISLENTQLRRYALEPAGTFFFRCWTLFSDGV